MKLVIILCLASLSFNSEGKKKINLFFIKRDDLYPSVPTYLTKFDSFHWLFFGGVIKLLAKPFFVLFEEYLFKSL